MYPEENDNALNYEQRSSGSAKTIGQKLQEARIANNKTVEEIAGQLRLAEKFIIDLENDNFSRFASTVYAKGYLRSYVKLLKLPENEILKQFSGADLGSIVATHQPQFIGTHQPFLTKKHLQWILFSVASIILFAFIFFKNSSSTDSMNTNVISSEDVKSGIPIEVTNLQDQDDVKNDEDQVANQPNQASPESVPTEEVAPQQNAAVSPVVPQVVPQAAPQVLAPVAPSVAVPLPAPAQNKVTIEMRSAHDTNFDPEKRIRTFRTDANVNGNRR